MKFYDKEIRSKEELKLEIQRLKDEIKSAEPQQLFNVSDILKKKEKKEDEAEGTAANTILSSLIAEIPFADILLGSGSGILQKVGLKIGEKSKKAAGKIAVSVAKELFGSYLKWKSVELSVKAIRYLISIRTKKKEEKKTGKQ